MNKHICNRRTRRRCGSLLTQVMIYATLGSTLMIMGGVLLQTSFRADSGDRREALMLSSLQRAERALRNDAEAAGFVFVNAGEVSATTTDGAAVQWQSDRSFD